MATHDLPVITKIHEDPKVRLFIISTIATAATELGKNFLPLLPPAVPYLAEMMNDEAKGRNVVTSVIVPSTIDTPQNREAMPDAKFDNWVKPEAIAEVIYRHCTDEFSIVREPVIKVYGNA